MIKLWVFANGAKLWRYNSQYHRTDGPAVISNSGHCQWFWHGKELSEFEHMMITRQEQTHD
jgi:hypothetical protein